MQLGNLNTAAGPRAVACHNGQFFDLAAGDPGLPTSLRDALALDGGLDRLQRAAERAIAKGATVTGTLRAPIERPGKVICIGLNYKDHARESGVEPPPEPVVFNKFPQTVIGPDEPIRLPACSQQVDYEAELVVVIGRKGKNIPQSQALSYVAGYMNGNDVSARDWQLNKPGKQWLLGKTPDTFAPTGPWLVTADAVADPHQLQVQLRLNGQTLQNSSTRELIFRIDVLLSYVSQITTLEPGDLVFTGTPPGVGMARKPPIFLKPGDLCEVDIAGLGVLRNPVVAGD